MKRQELLEKLNLVKYCLGAQTFIPILTHFCFYKDKIVTFNGAQTISTKFDSNISCGVPGDLFYKLVNSYQDDNITLEQKGNKLVITCSDSVSDLVILPSTDFISDESQTDSIKKFEVTAEFFKGVEKCLFSSGTNPLKGSLFGVTFDSTLGKVSLYSSDNIRISRFITTIVAPSMKILLPRVFCELIAAVGKEFEKGLFHVGANFISIDFGDTKVISKVIRDTTFLDFEGAISSVDNESQSFQKIPETFSSILDRCLILQSSEVTPTGLFELKNEQLKVMSQSSYGELTDYIKLQTIVDTTFKMDIQFLKEAIQNIDLGCFVKVGNSNTIFVGKKDSYTHLLMSY